MRVSYRLNLSTFDTFTEFFSEIFYKNAPAAYGMRRARVWLPFLQAALTSFPAVWAGAFQGDGAGRSKSYYKADLLHAGVPIEQWPVSPYAKYFHSFS